ncbi:hypothetical protein [Shimia sp.]|uniref:hypothetical protein n=1 Tax=Shimia sp. TaxID=1954381 RepID=UPI003BAA6CEC
MLKYGLIGSLCALTASLGWGVYQTRALSKLEAENVALAAQVKTLSARTQNIKEDNQSDAEVDAMPDLIDVPDRWLMQPGADTYR